MENNLRAKIQSFLEGEDWFTKKIHGNIYQAGLPDLMAIRNNEHLWIETKSKGDKLRPLQEIVFKQMKDKGAQIFVAYDVNDFLEWYHKQGD